MATRTLQIEITLPNPDGRLLPGAYVQATLPMAAVGTLTVPANTLLFRAEGPTVAVVGANGKVALHPVQIARTLGKTLEIDTGVSPGDRIVLNPSDSLATGDVVIAKAAAPEQVAGKAAGKPASNPAANSAVNPAVNSAAMPPPHRRHRRRHRALPRRGPDREDAARLVRAPRWQRDAPAGSHRPGAAGAGRRAAGRLHGRPRLSPPRGRDAGRLAAEPAGDTYWQRARPSHASLTPDWWQAFKDPLLDELETRALAANQTLAAAAAHYAQARATLASTAAAQLPSVGLNAGASREKISADRPLTNYAQRNQSTVQNDTQVGATVSYELDLFGRIRRNVEAARASTEQAADDLANARLVLTADLATAYLALRETRCRDRRGEPLDGAAAEGARLRERAARAGRGVGPEPAAAALAARRHAHPGAVAAQAPRQQDEHAIATLVGTPAPSFSIAPRVQPLIAPALPTGLPSDLLQRRPDVASAERAMAAANAQIGVARAAYFPRIMLSPDIGWDATRFASLFTVPSLLWSVGALGFAAAVRGRPPQGRRRFRAGRLRGRAGQLPADRARRLPGGAECGDGPVRAGRGRAARPPPRWRTRASSSRSRRTATRAA